MRAIVDEIFLRELGGFLVALGQKPTGQLQRIDNGTGYRRMAVYGRVHRLFEPRRDQNCRNAQAQALEIEWDEICRNRESGDTVGRHRRWRRYMVVISAMLV